MAADFNKPFYDAAAFLLAVNFYEAPKTRQGQRIVFTTTILPHRPPHDVPRLPSSHIIYYTAAEYTYIKPLTLLSRRAAQPPPSGHY